MPELPEVETVRRDLEPVIAGRRIDAVEVLGARTARRPGAREALAARVPGCTVASVDRHGKYLLVRTDDPVVVVHLGMSGQLRWVPDGSEPRPPHTHVVFRFGPGELRFVDPRTFGEVFATDDALPELAHLGVDAYTGVPSWKALAAILRRRRTMLKPLLLGQSAVAGLGNIYCDETLFAAGLRHDRRSDTLTDAEVRRLHRAMARILGDAVDARGSTLDDAQYRDLAGRPGGYRSNHRVYDREGEPCSACGARIQRTYAAGRSTYFCPRCQS